MSFTLLPAVDVAAGHAVGVGRLDDAGDASDAPPLELALGWQAGGADWLHLVDLDAAFSRGSNAELLASVIDEVGLAVQLSGGITDDRSLTRALATGAQRVVVATQALDDLDWCARALDAHHERLAIALDVRVEVGANGARRHRLAARGSGRDSGDLFEVLERLTRAGCRRYVVTDVSRDGKLSGPNTQLCRTVAAESGVAVIASGGITTAGDLVDLAATPPGTAPLDGAIVGTALYSGNLTLPDALRAVRNA